MENIFIDEHTFGTVESCDILHMAAAPACTLVVGTHAGVATGIHDSAAVIVIDTLVFNTDCNVNRCYYSKGSMFLG